VLGDIGLPGARPADIWAAAARHWQSIVTYHQRMRQLRASPRCIEPQQQQQGGGRGSTPLDVGLDSDDDLDRCVWGGGGGAAGRLCW